MIPKPSSVYQSSMTPEQRSATTLLSAPEAKAKSSSLPIYVVIETVRPTNLKLDRIDPTPSPGHWASGFELLISRISIRRSSN